MNYILLPTLRHAATVRTATLVYNDQELKNMLFPPPKDLKEQEWRLIRKKILEKLSNLLPVTDQERVAEFFRQMYYEVERWEKDHNYVLKHVGTRFSDFLVWKTDGTINRLATAKKLVINDTIDEDIRFIMACTYFLEDEILDLWQSIKKNDEDTVGNTSEESIKKRITLKGTNAAVRFWMEWLKIENARHWSQMIDGYFGLPFTKKNDARFRVSCFYHFLHWQKQYYFLFVYYSHCHTDDFPNCLIKLDEPDRLDLFEVQTVHALCVCMRWPFRSRFLKMAKKGINRLTAEEFEEVMDFLLTSYLTEGHKDFYLLETFCQMAPIVLKEKMKNRDRFIQMTEDVFKSKRFPQTVKDIVRKYFCE